MLRPVIAFAVVLALSAQLQAQPAVPFEDAGLHAVQFVDKSEGWAVGDDGAIWHSIDGGKTWERQKSGTRASLRGVHFTSPYNGWAVGRLERPTGLSVGVLLRTSDGGIEWEEVSSQLLPGINAVRFFDENNGIVCGDGSDAFPGGVFSTTDGGKSWLPTASKTRAPSWRALDFTPARTGVLGGAWSKLSSIHMDRTLNLAEAEIDPLSGRTVHGVKAGEQRSYAVGDGGMVLTSGDGRKWGFANIPLTPASLAACDFRCVAAVGTHVWVAGRPGSIVLHSADHGKNWDVLPTHSSVPLNGLHFLDSQMGWAVGELGTILSTVDGGKNWTMRHLGGQRAAVLTMQASSHAVPLETVAMLGHVDGYLVASLSMITADPATASPNRAADDLRLRHAMRLAGGAVGETVFGFPLAPHLATLPPRDLMATWDRAHAGGADEQMLRQAVLAIRTWQPEVLLVESAEPTSPASSILMLLAAQEAFKKASDPRAFPEQITELGLKPWAPKKLYSVGPAGKEILVKLDFTEFHSKLGDSLQDFAETARRIVADDSALMAQCGYKLVSHRLAPGAEFHEHLMQGIELARGGSARRDASTRPLDVEATAERKKASQSRRHFQGLAAAENADYISVDKLLAPLGDSLKAMPDDLAARTAHGVAMQFVRIGRWAEAREVFSLLSERYPGHPLAVEAVRWMLRYHSSSETRRRVELQQQVIFQQAAFQPKGRDLVVPVGGSAVGSLVGMTEDRYRVEDADATQKWHEAGLALEPKLAAFGPASARDPAAWLCLMAARRHLGKHAEAEKFIMDYFKSAPQAIAAAAGADVYRDALAAELWTINRAYFIEQPKPLAISRHTDTRPFLDGKLDDACWQLHKPVVLKPATAASDGKNLEAYRTEVLFCYDDRFLYIGVRCSQPTGSEVLPVTKRSRDADLTGQDRVDILLDLDRDYQTYYRFQIDRRGNLAEDCWGDRTWNPRYFVGFHGEDTGWTSEYAIPLGELTGDRPSHGRHWAVNATRVLPGKGIQSWSTPADATPRPEGMGLLEFRAEK